MAEDRWIGNIDGVAQLRKAARERLGTGSLLEELVLYNGMHCGDVIAEDRFDKLLEELTIMQSSSAQWVEEFVSDMRALIKAARRERNPVVFV